MSKNKWSVDVCAVRMGVVLITSVGVHCGWFHSLGLGARPCENGERGLRNKRIYIHLSALDYGVTGLGALSSCHTDSLL